jgi:hypothetical protein
MRHFFLFILFFCQYQLYAQQSVTGHLYDRITKQPIEGATIEIPSRHYQINSDSRGKFTLANLNASVGFVHISCIGYENISFSFATISKKDTIYLQQKQISLTDVKVNSKEGQEYKTISNLDIKLRGVNNSQEVLRMVPGLFIGQHQGGGKAEQIFIRGFDCDHGTDINIMSDGMPVNMVSQAHGQGYADMHYIIPETIESIEFQKGPYNTSKGNFTTSGYVDLNTKNSLNQNLIKLEGGMFDTYRAVGLFNLLDTTKRNQQQSWYIGSEYAYSKGYFDHPQNFNRFNLFTKYNGKLNNNNYLSFSASTFNSKWNASGQIPDRAVAEGLIGFYGAIDSTEGGETARTNANLQLLTFLKNGGYVKNQLYYSNYFFDLHTNFTFYLNDPINGDQIRQKENRNLFGYNGSYHQQYNIGTVLVNSDAGIGFRWDMIKNSELSHTKDRFTLLNRLTYGDVAEGNVFGYINETFHFTDKLKLNAGLRADQMYNQYVDHLKLDSQFRTQAAILSPKLSLYYQTNDQLQWYLNLGKGFHSNNTKVAVLGFGRKVLPSAYSSDLGAIFKPFDKLLLQASVWYLYLQQEFVYNGDDGTPEPSGRTARTGFDASLRYEPIKSLYIDADVNYAHGRYLDEEKGKDFIPLAPVWSSTGGITYKTRAGLNGSLRYRWLGDRPANEDYSLTAAGYFVNDFVLNYTQKKYELGCSINNIFNVKWKETQFDTESRLKNEPNSVDEIHFTPGTKLAAKLSLTIFF